MAQPVILEDAFHATLKMLASEPKEHRGIGEIAQDFLIQNTLFKEKYEEVKNKMEESSNG